MASRGSCGGPLLAGVPGAVKRRQWSKFSAAMVDAPPEVTAEAVLGMNAPGQMLDGFSSTPDPMTGEVEWSTFDRCPLPGIDPECPRPSGNFISDVCAVSRELAAGLPHTWAPARPSDALRDGLVVLKSECDKAEAYRHKHEETW